LRGKSANAEEKYLIEKYVKRKGREERAFPLYYYIYRVSMYIL